MGKGSERMNTLVKDACFRYPTPVLAGLSAYQVYGWVNGERLLGSVNAEAILFTVSAGYVAFMGWFAHKIDDSSMEEEPTTSESRYWLFSIIVGAIGGVVLRLLE